MSNAMFNIDKIIEKFVADSIKELYPDSTIRLEYFPSFDKNMQIDILVVVNGKWIPIELKYKTKKALIECDNEIFNLKSHNANDLSSYSYLKDIERIEKIKVNIENFEKGYTIFITNDSSYKKVRTRDSINYLDFSLEDGVIKKGILNWKELKGAAKYNEYKNPILLKNKYEIRWKEYSKVANENFITLINEIK